MSVGQARAICDGKQGVRLLLVGMLSSRDCVVSVCTELTARLSQSCTAPPMPMEFHARPRAVSEQRPFSSDARCMAPCVSISLRVRSSLSTQVIKGLINTRICIYMHVCTVDVRYVLM